MKHLLILISAVVVSGALPPIDFDLYGDTTNRNNPASFRDERPRSNRFGETDPRPTVGKLDHGYISNMLPGEATRLVDRMMVLSSSRTTTRSVLAFRQLRQQSCNRLSPATPADVERFVKYMIGKRYIHREVYEELERNKCRTWRLTQQNFVSTYPYLTEAHVRIWCEYVVRLGSQPRPVNDVNREPNMMEMPLRRWLGFLGAARDVVEETARERILSDNSEAATATASSEDKVPVATLPNRQAIVSSSSTEQTNVPSEEHSAANTQNKKRKVTSASEHETVEGPKKQSRKRKVAPVADETRVSEPEKLADDSTTAVIQQDTTVMDMSNTVDQLGDTDSSKPPAVIPSESKPTIVIDLEDSEDGKDAAPDSKKAAIEKSDVLESFDDEGLWETVLSGGNSATAVSVPTAPLSRFSPHNGGTFLFPPNIPSPAGIMSINPSRSGFTSPWGYVPAPAAAALATPQVTAPHSPYPEIEMTIIRTIMAENVVPITAGLFAYSEGIANHLAHRMFSTLGVMPSMSRPDIHKVVHEMILAPGAVYQLPAIPQPPVIRPQGFAAPAPRGSTVGSLLGAKFNIGEPTPSSASQPQVVAAGNQQPVAATLGDMIREESAAASNPGTMAAAAPVSLTGPMSAAAPANNTSALLVGPIILQFRDRDLTTPVDRIANRIVYRHDVDRIRGDDKPRLTHGTPNLAQSANMAYVESIPVESRIRAIQKLTRIVRRCVVPRHLQTRYEKFLVSLMFIDVRVLQVLAELASSRRTRYGPSAVEIIDYIQKSFPLGNFQYLTPAYLLDWYELLGTYDMRLFVLPGDEERITSHQHVDSTRPPILVQIVFDTWKRLFLRKRLELLETTGYEFSRIN